MKFEVVSLFRLSREDSQVKGTGMLVVLLAVGGVKLHTFNRPHLWCSTWKAKILTKRYCLASAVAKEI